MLKTLGVVHAGSSAAPGRHKLTRKLGGKSLLEWVVRRVTDAEQLDRVIVAVEGTAALERELREVVPSDVPVVRRGEVDALARFAAIVDAYPAPGLVRICADNPYVDPVLIDRLVTTAAEHAGCDYISYRVRDRDSTLQSSLGMFAEWCRASALKTACREATSPDDRRNETRYLYSHPEKFVVRLIPAPGPLDREDVRLRVDHEEDWEHAEAIFEALGPDGLDWQRITGFLHHQPALRKRMAHLNRKNAHA